MAKYRKRPVVIEAIKWTGDNLKEIQNFAKGFREITTSKHFKNRLAIITLEGTMTVSVGDFIIKEVLGEVYPCKPYIFEKTYEAI